MGCVYAHVQVRQHVYMIEVREERPRQVGCWARENGSWVTHTASQVACTACTDDESTIYGSEQLGNSGFIAHLARASLFVCF